MALPLARLLHAVGTKVPAPVLARAAQAVFALPEPVRRRLGTRRRIDGHELNLDSQLVLFLLRLQGVDGLIGPGSLAQQRESMVRLSASVGGHTPGVTTRAMTVDGADGPLPARLYTPSAAAQKSPLIVFFHGGGFVLGDLDSHDAPCRYIAANAGARVLAVDYRLAPEHPFPAAADDAVAATAWALANADRLGADPAAVAVCGDSAGGNLAGVAARELSLADAPRPAAALLFYPVTGYDPELASRDTFADGFFLTRRDIDSFADQYTPDLETRDDPRTDLLHADGLAGMPRTHVVVAGFDPLRDEGLRFAERLSQAGVDVTSTTESGAIHGFISMLGVSETARAAVDEAVEVLRAALGNAARK
ncbi:alpha/beta hydrolase [Tsukamurella sp. 8F]|uniref:alpha/beta hydrolase n=1 Tax=unclassified Tsukamurella TaxID=2633480 RepID=UPI0023B94225|nr:MULTISPECIES: alpha/beta hydrolase [unclassified Tsukamurella]MDF0530631.1 alpha/beta hydrolase [Tsukamurella sp. 8J]MDF0587832.1 alpha/beta hydrolase [Tsukamurella sp. 8F]